MTDSSLESMRKLIKDPLIRALLLFGVNRKACSGDQDTTTSKDQSRQDSRLTAFFIFEIRIRIQPEKLFDQFSFWTSIRNEIY